MYIHLQAPVPEVRTGNDCGRKRLCDRAWPIFR